MLNTHSWRKHDRCYLQQDNEQLPDSPLPDSEEELAEGAVEDGFNAPISSDTQQTNQLPSRLRRYQPSLSERANLAGGRKVDAGGDVKALANPLGQGKQVVAEKGAQAIRRQAGKVLGKIAARLGGGAVGGPLGWVLSAGAVIKDLIGVGWKYLEDKIGTTLVLSFILGVLVLIPLTLLATILGKYHNGPDISGGTGTQPLASTYEAGLAAGERGLVMSNKLEDLQKVRDRIKRYLSQNPATITPQVKSQADTLLTQIDTLERTMRTSAYAADNTTAAKSIKSYQQLLTNLYELVFPDSKAPRERVISLLSSGAIRTNEYCKGTEHDLREGPLSPTLLNLVAEMGKFASTNGFSITLSCAKSRHGGKTLHARGQAVDIQVTPGDDAPAKLLPYLFNNRTSLQIAELIFNASVGGKPAGYYNYDSFPPSQGRPLSKGHLTHIHIGVRR